MIVGDLVKVNNKFVEEYGVVLEIIQEDQIVIEVVVQLFNGDIEPYHPSRVRVLAKETRQWQPLETS